MEIGPRQIVATAALLGVLTGCDGRLLGVLGMPNQGQAAIYFANNIHPPVQPGATLSIPLRVMLAQNESPVQDQFRLDYDAPSRTFTATGATTISGATKTPPYRVETLERVITAPDIASSEPGGFQIHTVGIDTTNKLLEQAGKSYGCDTVYIGVFPSETTKMLQENPERNVSFRSVSTEAWPYRLQEASHQVIETEDQLTEFLSGFTGSTDATGQPIPVPRPVVDFASESLVVVSFGAQSTIAITGTIARIEELPDTLQVLPVMWFPSPGLAVPSAMGYPIHMVAIPKPHKPIVFTKTYSTWAGWSL